MWRRLLKIVLGIAVALVLFVAGALAYIDWSGIPRYAPQKVELHVDVTDRKSVV